ncbi:MAG: FAD-dependent oxidoreductase [Bacteroidetes bacterium]|nr:FAD-dependent oxidoreductase [Bacteroidota bacterium]
MKKPVILAVDNHSEDLDKIENALQNGYKKHYKILKSDSPVAALELIKNLKLLGEHLCMILSEQKMPQIIGTDFLMEASKLYPDAIKVLLTSHRDSEAAIHSINNLLLDQYMIKPFSPPEQKLYPVIDELLKKWHAKYKMHHEGIRIIGTRWTPECYPLKEFLSRNHVPYQWVDMDQDASMRELVIQTAGDEHSIPLVLFEDGSYLIKPEIHELAEKVGLHISASKPFYDLIIVGGGPAGLANAVYGASEGLKTILVEQSAPGGQAGTSSRIENYLGFPMGITGADLAQRATAQATRFGAEILTASEVVGIETDGPYRKVKLSNGSTIAGYTVLITTGMTVRKLEATGIDSLIGIGVYYGAAMTEASTYKDKVICIIGGANSAGQGALFFARYSSHVKILIHADNLHKSMSHYLIARIEKTKNIEVIPFVEVTEVMGKDKLEMLKIRNVNTGEISEMEADAMFIFIGASPRSEMVSDIIEIDDGGFIYTGTDLPRNAHGVLNWPLKRDPFLFETNVPGIFAAGDIRHGANRRVAAAVGEGSAAIYTIRKYLDTV